MAKTRETWANTTRTGGLLLVAALLAQPGCGSTEDRANDDPASTSGANTTTSPSSDTHGATNASQSTSSTGSSAGGSGNLATGAGAGGGSVGCGGAAGGESSSDGSGASSSSSGGGTGGANPGDCGDCEACLGDGVFVECDPLQIGGCVCELPESDDRDDHATLASCQLESPCPPALYSEGGPLGTWTDRDCLFSALRDRTVGRYEFFHDVADGSYTNTDWLLLVTQQGDVLRTAFTDAGVVSSTTASRNYRPVERCTLAGSDYFGACLAEADGCDLITEWFLQCTPNPGECPQ